jgi:hypothetical protein
MNVPAGSLVMGLPAKFVPLPGRLKSMLDRTWRHYVSYREQYLSRP